MQSCQKVFAAADVSGTLAYALGREVDRSVLAAGTPAAVQRLLRRCLTHEPRRALGGYRFSSTDSPARHRPAEVRGPPVSVNERFCGISHHVLLVVIDKLIKIRIDKDTGRVGACLRCNN